MYVLPITSILWRIPVVQTWGNGTNLCATAADAATAHIPTTPVLTWAWGLQTATQCTWWISGWWAGPVTAEVQCVTYYFPLLHIVLINFMISATSDDDCKKLCSVYSICFCSVSAYTLFFMLQEQLGFHKDNILSGWCKKGLYTKHKSFCTV